MADVDPVFCEHCGSESEMLGRRLQEMENWLQNEERRSRTLKSQLNALRENQNQQQELDPQMADAEELFDYWKKRLSPKARELKGDRLTKVLARLHAGYSVVELKEAVDGCALVPYVSDEGRQPTGLPNERFADLELICRSENHVEKFRAHAQSAALERHDANAKLETEYAHSVKALTDAVGARLLALRGWSVETVRNLGLGLDQRLGRVVFPARDSHGTLVGLCRYAPNPDRRAGAKLLAEGERELFPAPETIDAQAVWLVEGEADVVAMWSIDMPAVGVPGVQTWKKGWEHRFAAFDRIRICFDCDEKGREAAKARAKALSKVATVQIVELDESRQDGFDVGDLVKEHGLSAAPKLSALATKTGSLTPIVRRTLFERPYAEILKRLDDRDCRVRDHGDHAEAQCPCHDDRQPSMSIAEGDDKRCLLTCHAGCDPDDIVRALGLEMRELFAA